MTDWQILGDGDRWCVEEVTVPHPNETVQKNFVTTYGSVLTSRAPDSRCQCVLCYIWIEQQNLLLCLQDVQEVPADSFGGGRLQPIVHGSVSARNQNF